MTYSFRFAPVISRLDQLLDGFVVTLWVSLAAILLGLALGIAGAMALRARPRWLRAAVAGYVEAIRNTPLLAQLFFVYFGLPALGIRLDPLVASVVTLVLNLGAYVSEIVRGGLDAVPQGQTDAGLALGLGRIQVLVLIVLKPALKIMFPALASQFTLLMLATSILSQIGVEDLFHQASMIDSATYRSFEVYVVVCGFYLAMALAFRLGFALLYRVLFAERVPALVTTAAAPP